MFRTATARDRRAGTVVLMLAVAALGIMGASGLVLDLGRFYVYKNELQSFSDAAALAAIHKLDGTVAGFSVAVAAVGAEPNRWEFATKTIPTVTTEFSTAVDGPWEATPATATDYRFVRVTTATTSPNYFMRMFPFVGADSTIRASATAGLIAVPAGGDGVLPFSPDAHDPNDPTGNFGFLLGRSYTLRWDNRVGGTAPPGSFKTSIDGIELVGCDMDMEDPTFQPGETSNSQRGYIDLANLGPLSGGGGASLIRNIVEGRVSFSTFIEPFNYWVVPEPGEKQTVLGSLDNRVASDTDPITPRYFNGAQTAPGVPPAEVMKTTFRDATNYTVGEPRPPLGNGRRIVTVPINDPLNAGVVIGFGGFLLPPEPCAEVKVGGKKYFPCCGEYVGAVTRSGAAAPGSGAGLLEAGLVR